MLAELDPARFPPASRAAHELVVAGIAMRRLRTKTARAALARAERSARHAGIPALAAEVESASLVLNTPAARLIARGEERLLLLEEVEALLASRALVVDACREIGGDEAQAFNALVTESAPNDHNLHALRREEAGKRDRGRSCRRSQSSFCRLEHQGPVGRAPI
jgi:hypothetical protein